MQFTEMLRTYILYRKTSSYYKKL